MRRPTSTQQCMSREQLRHDNATSQLARATKEIEWYEADEVNLNGQEAMRLSVLRASLSGLQFTIKDARENLRRLDLRTTLYNYE